MRTWWEIHFPELDPSILRETDWTVKAARRWFYTEGIIILDARASVYAVERWCSLAPCRHQRVLMSGDNMAVVLSFGRGRARSFGLLVQIRCFYGLCFCLKDYAL